MATESAPWQIKAMPVSTREKAVRYARMRGETMAEWVSRAVDTQASIEDGDRVLPPGEPEQTTQVAGPDLHALAAALQTMQEARAMAEAAGLPVPRSLARAAFALVRQSARKARGLPPLAPRRRLSGPDSSEPAR